MFRYVLCGVEVRSEVALPSLRPCEEAPAGACSLTLRVAAEPFGEPRRWRYDEEVGPDDETWRAVGICDRGYLVRLSGWADFFLERGSFTAAVRVAPSASPSVIEPLFLEQALPLWLSLLDRPSLHASAVALGQGDGARALAFAGRSGAGKSTLVTSLVTGARGLAPAGALMADDCLALELTADRALAHVGHRAVRLLGDSAEAFFASATAGEPSLNGGKRRLALRAADRALPLARVYVLAPTDGPPAAEPLRPRDAIAALAANLFRVDPEDKARLASELTLLESIAARARVTRLLVPRRFEALAEVRSVIERDLAAG